jgi:hypothetical protein
VALAFDGVPLGDVSRKPRPAEKKCPASLGAPRLGRVFLSCPRNGNVRGGRPNGFRTPAVLERLAHGSHAS